MTPSPVSPRPGPRTIVLGLGNPVLGDDGVGWRVADEVERRLHEIEPRGGVDDGRTGDVDVDRLSVGGLRLMERLTGYESAIVVDAATIEGRASGTVETWPLDALPGGVAGHLDSAHDTSLRTALGLGRRLGAKLPERVAVVIVRAEALYEFSEALTPAVEAAVPRAASAVMDLLAGVPTGPPTQEKEAARIQGQQV